MDIGDLLDLKPKEVKELERFILKRIEVIIFKTKRPSGIEKVKGGYKIEDDTGLLRRTLKANQGFMRIDKRGLVFDIKMVSYYKFLDDERRADLNWYLGEAIFQDKLLAKKIAQITARGIKAKIIELISK